MLHCDVCGRKLSDENDKNALVGMSITVKANEEDDPAVRQWHTELMKPYELDRTYCICFPCWLSALGIEPEVRHE